MTETNTGKGTGGGGVSAVLALCGAAAVFFTVAAGSRNPSWVLRGMFVVWVGAPFVALAFVAARRRGAAVVLAVLGAVGYAVAALHPMRQAAAPFTLGPVVMWATVMVIAWRRR